MTQLVAFFTPARRKAIYAVGAAVFGLLVTLGVIDAATSGEWLGILDRVLGLVTLILAAVNTDTSTDSGMPAGEQP